jgi:GMP synthase PP-ATPase subunit
MGSNDNAVENVAKGATKALLEYTGEKIKWLAQQFKNREIAFIQNPETIAIVKDQKKNSEYEIFKKHVNDKDLCILFQSGLALRRIEKNKANCEQLRNKILSTHNIEGLHIAQFVQNGLFNKYFAILIERGLTSEQNSKEITKFLKNIEITNSFIQKTDNIDKVAATIIARIQSHSPNVYVISGSMQEAIIKCRKIKNKVMPKISGYKETLIRTDIAESYFLQKGI